MKLFGKTEPQSRSDPEPSAVAPLSGTGPPASGRAIRTPSDPSGTSDRAATLANYVRHVSRSSKVLWIDGLPWVLRARNLRPLVLPHRMKPVDRVAIRRAVKATGAVLAQWTEGWDTALSDWWYVCCDQRDYDLTNLKKDPRYEVRKGLEQCEVKPLDPTWFAENGYAVYAAAFQRYGTKPLLAEDGFVGEFLRQAEYPGRETWGAFINGRLVAWQSCIVVDDAVLSSSSKSDPAHYKAKPNNALVYVLTRHYLIERQFAYVTSGARVVLHDTNAQDFKERMGYRKVYCSLRAELSPAAAFLDALAPQTWVRRLRLGGLLKGPLDKLDALSSVARIARSFASSPEARPTPRSAAP